jgi:hypothetical protein
MQVTNTDSWHVGLYIAKQQMNNHPHEGGDMLTTNQCTTVKSRTDSLKIFLEKVPDKSLRKSGGKLYRE